MHKKIPIFGGIFTMYLRCAKIPFAAAGLAALLLPAMAGATTVMLHSGAVNPVSEGWTNYTGTGGATTAGPVLNDLGTGLDAWAIDDNSSGTDTGLYYYQNTSAAVIAEGNTAGWRLSMSVRVVNTPDALVSIGGFGLASAVSGMYRDGSRDWYLGIGSQADGDPIVRMPGGATFNLEGGGSGYHFYELVYNPAVTSAKLYIDGIERASGLVGAANTQTRVVFGATTSPDAGQGNYSLVRFATSQAAVVPVPPALLLFGSALGALGVIRRRN